MVEEIHVNDLLAAFALGCLEPEESQRVAEHLATCLPCRADLASYLEVTGQLGKIVPQSEPPAHLKQSLLSRLEAERKTGLVDTPAEASAQSRWKRFLNRLQASPSWAAASLVLILVLGFSNLLLWQQVRQLQTGVLGGEDTLQTLVLEGSQAAPGATGLIVISVDGLHGTLVVDRLPALDEDHQYQLWLIDDNEKRTSGAVFSVSEEGYGSVWVGSPEPLISYPAFGVTIEPKGGSPQPTGERVLGGKL